MNRVISMCLDAAISAVILIPLFLYLNKRYFHDRKRMIGYLLFAVYLSGVFAVAGLPDIRYVRFSFRYNIVPFAYMFTDLDTTLLNVLLFIPMGFFLPVLWKPLVELCKFRPIGTPIPKLTERSFRSERYVYSGPNGTASLWWIS